MFYRIALFLIIGGLVSCSSSTERTETNIAAVEPTDTIKISKDLTFWEDAAPIIFENCTPCHHQNGAGPFSLTDFDAVKKRTRTIRQVVADGYMPPWPADPEFSRFKGEKILSKKEKLTLVNWIDQGAPEGMKTEVIPQPEIFTAENPEKPDVIIPYSDTVPIPGQNLDLFRIAKIPINLPRDTVIKAIHFRPGNKQLVHHVNGHLINYEKGMKEDSRQGEWIIDAEKMNSLEAYRLMKIANDDGSYPVMRVSAFNYLPGVEPLQYPEGIGGLFINENAAFLLNTLHYGPSPLDTFDFSQIEIYFAEKRPERPVSELHMGTQGITKIEPEFILPAGVVSTFTTKYRLPDTISVLTVNPHMHLLGREFTAYAYSEDKSDTIPLIRIPEWDFRWQYFYTYEKVQVLPKGYTIQVVAVFDNTIDNPFNPNIPPKTLSEAGKNMKTTDEMFQFFINYIPYQKGDEGIEL
ncbi:hypothetical protein O3Q51_10315 [Cryomorphaceae bacterium 1068]|nr:hypothetical protein [Cryomorphaceae bacterium 1068]